MEQFKLEYPNELKPKPNEQHRKGLGVFVTSLFLIGCQVGGGIVAIPKAIANSYWYGVGVLTVAGLAATVSALRLGDSWNLLRKRWPNEYRDTVVRKPYAEICGRALGPWARHLASASVIFSTFGISTIYLLLASDNVEHLLRLAGWDTGLTFCHLVLLFAALLTPPTLLGSPKEFWPVAVLSMGTSFIACICILAGTLVDAMESVELGLTVGNESANASSLVSSVSSDQLYPNASYSLPTFVSFSLGYGAFSFAYSGHSSFPVFQSDMKQPQHFWKSVMIAFSVVLLCYIPVSILGYGVYGDGVHQNIAVNIRTPAITACLSVAITLHLAVTFIMSINPPCQELEELFRIPHSFNWKRVLLRLLVVMASVLVCESIPSFGLILDLVGATTMNLNAYVLPGLAYLALKRKLSAESPSTYCQPRDKLLLPPTVWEWIVNCGIAALGIAGGIAGTYAALLALFTHEFTTPCYLRSHTVETHDVPLHG